MRTDTDAKFEGIREYTEELLRQIEGKFDIWNEREIEKIIKTAYLDTTGEEWDDESEESESDPESCRETRYAFKLHQGGKWSGGMLPQSRVQGHEAGAAGQHENNKTRARSSAKGGLVCG